MIRLTEGCVLVTPLLLLWMWLKPAGLRCALAVALGLVLLMLAMRGIAAISFVARPFVAYDFEPLYPHSPNSSFPSFTTACFALVAVPVSMGWRKLGWLSVAIAAEVAFGCVYVGVHYCTDVLAGAALGAASGWVAWMLLGRRPLAGAVVRTDEVLRKVHLRRRPAVSVDMS